jgi:Fur family peroxide stress response transcriptional regulator
MKHKSSDVERSIERFRAACGKAGVKLTHQRLEVFREVAASLDHPDAEAVYERVKVRIPTVSLDTVYRTLWLLNDIGLVATLGPRRESVRFDANLERHHHYVCVRCGLAKDFVSADLDSIRAPRAVKTFGSVITTHVEVRGLCAACSKSRQSKTTKPNKARSNKGRRKK